MECKGSGFYSSGFLSTLENTVAKPEAVVSDESLVKLYTVKPCRVEKQVMKIPV